MTAPDATAADERELARLLGERLGKRLHGLFTVGSGVSLHLDFAPEFLPPRLEVLVSAAHVLGSLVLGAESQPKEFRRLSEELYRLVSSFRETMLAFSQAAPGRSAEAAEVAGRLGQTHEAVLTTLEAFLRLFLLETTFTHEKEVGREFTKSLVSLMSESMRR